jgi:D-mannonate dehydratase
MKMTFRWYGESDAVTLRNIQQIPLMSGIVSAVYDEAPGRIWPERKIEAIKSAAAKHNLKFEVVESIPVHNDIKLGTGNRNKLIDNYCKTIRLLGYAGIKVICYNFMPVFDWMRSTVERRLPDGSITMAYDEDDVMAIDPVESGFALHGWDVHSKANLLDLMSKFRDLGADQLWDNLAYFLQRVMPVCEEMGISMAIHPDDPPWDIFGLPRIITGISSYARLKEIYPGTVNGITLCLGSLGADTKNNLVQIASEYAEHIHFVHARNIKIKGERVFEESAHPAACGSLDIYAVLKALHDNGFDGYIRPDHGRMIWNETGRHGYGLYDRALGAMYLSGLWESLVRQGE